MHNLHLVRVLAENPQDACDIVDAELDNYGNENNFYSIVGCVSQNDEIFVLNKNDTFVENLKPIKEINEMVRNWMNYAFNHNNYKALIQKSVNEPLSKYEWLRIKEYAYHMYQIESFNSFNPNEEFDVLNDAHEFYCWKIEENGVTDMCHASDGDTVYIVFINMHS